MEKTQRKIYDLTNGGILQKLLLVAVPVMANQLMQMTYNLTDMFWLGRLSSDAIAASGTAGLFMWLSAGFMMLGRMGSEIGVSQSLGRGDKSQAKSYAQNAYVMAAVTGVLYALVLVFFRSPLISFFNIREQHVVADSEAYLAIVAVSVPFTYLTSVLAGAFNASGNARTPFYLSCAGLILNMILDPVLIFVLDLGVMGAAIATSTAQAFVFVIYLIAMKKSRSRPFDTYKFIRRPQWAKVKMIFKWAIPVCLESLLFCLLSMITARFEAGFGADAIATSRVGSQVESLSWLVGGGFGSALIAYVGQNFGAKKWDRIYKGVRLSLVLMGIWGVAITGLLFFGGGFLFQIFVPDEALLGMGTAYLQILAFAQLPMCLEAVAGGAFKGMGRSVPPAAVSIITNTLRVPAAYLLSLTPLGLSGIWIAIALSSVIKAAWALTWYLVSARKQKKLLPQETA